MLHCLAQISFYPNLNQLGHDQTPNVDLSSEAVRLLGDLIRSRELVQHGQHLIQQLFSIQEKQNVFQ